MISNHFIFPNISHEIHVKMHRWPVQIPAKSPRWRHPSQHLNAKGKHVCFTESHGLNHVYGICICVNIYHTSYIYIISYYKLYVFIYVYICELFINRIHEVVFFVILVLRLAGSTGKRRQTPPLCLRAYAEFPVDLYFSASRKNSYWYGLCIFINDLLSTMNIYIHTQVEYVLPGLMMRRYHSRVVSGDSSTRLQSWNLEDPRTIAVKAIGHPARNK